MSLPKKDVLTAGVAILLTGVLPWYSALAPGPLPADPILGAEVFRQNCSTCHGSSGEGKDAAPPLNSLGHGDHHSDWELYMFVAEGNLGFGQMPAWRGKLSDLEIRSVIVYFKTLWTEDQRTSQRHINEIRPVRPRR